MIFLDIIEYGFVANAGKMIPVLSVRVKMTMQDKTIWRNNAIATLPPMYTPNEMKENPVVIRKMWVDAANDVSYELVKSL